MSNISRIFSGIKKKLNESSEVRSPNTCILWLAEKFKNSSISYTKNLFDYRMSVGVTPLPYWLSEKDAYVKQKRLEKGKKRKEGAAKRTKFGEKFFEQGSSPSKNICSPSLQKVILVVYSFVIGLTLKSCCNRFKNYF